MFKPGDVVKVKPYSMIQAYHEWGLMRVDEIINPRVMVLSAFQFDPTTHWWGISSNVHAYIDQFELVKERMRRKSGFGTFISSIEDRSNSSLMKEKGL